MKPNPTLALALAAAFLAIACAGCSTTQSVRVHPWERGLLADATMDPNRNPLGTQMMDHVTSSREAASGGRGVGGAGCGCN
jgi:outer membrane protein assembly factor BamE (lipoprotein component of BamABCDE complex)